MAVLIKVIKWIPLNIVSLFGILQACIKLIKELVTAVINFLAAIVVLIPGVDFTKANGVVLFVREQIEKIDEAVEKVKENVLKWVKA